MSELNVKIEKLISRLRGLKNSFRGVVRLFIASPVFFIAILLFAVVPLAAFEAHVVNITAIIEMPPMCSALSPGYWANHEGCFKGNGSSVWADEVNALSYNTFREAFATITGPQICSALWTPNCDEGHTLSGQLCRAKRHALANELNIVSGNLQLDALIALADGDRP